jgi:hypothetical protein
VIEGEVGDIVSIEVTAPGYAKWHLVIRFKKAGFMKFPVELEKEVEGITLSNGQYFYSREQASYYQVFSETRCN